MWIDEAELGIGDSLIRNIGKAIDATDFLVVLLSDNSVRSEWVLQRSVLVVEVHFPLFKDLRNRGLRGSIALDPKLLTTWCTPSSSIVTEVSPSRRAS